MVDKSSSIVKCGPLFVPSVSFFKFKHKKQWIKRYLVLIRKSHSGIQRLEIFTSEESYLKNTNLIKIIPLNNCFRIIQQDQKHKENVFEIHTKETIYYFSANSYLEMTDWLHLLQDLAFGLDEKKQTKEIICEENVFYSSINTLSRYKVDIGYTEAAVRCLLYMQHSSNNQEQEFKTFYLTFDSMSIYLIEGTKKIFSWPFRNIRKYGCTQETFSFEAGRKCYSGPGLFLFHTKEGPSIFYSLAEKVKNCFIQNSSSISSTVSSSNFISCKFLNTNQKQINCKELTSLNQHNSITSKNNHNITSNNNQSLFDEVEVSKIFTKRKTISPIKNLNETCKKNLNDLNMKCLGEHQKKIKKNYIGILNENEVDEDNELNKMNFSSKDYLNLSQTLKSYLYSNSKKNIYLPIIENQSSSLSILNTDEFDNNLNPISFNIQPSICLDKLNENSEKHNQLYPVTIFLNEKSNLQKNDFLNTEQLIKSSVKMEKHFKKNYHNVSYVNDLKSDNLIMSDKKNELNLDNKLNESLQISSQEFNIKNKNSIHALNKNEIEKSNNQFKLEKYNNFIINIETYLKNVFNKKKLNKEFLISEQVIEHVDKIKENNSIDEKTLQNLLQPLSNKRKNDSLNINKLILNLNKIDPEHYIQNECEYAKIMKKTFLEHL